MTVILLDIAGVLAGPFLNEALGTEWRAVTSPRGSIGNYWFRECAVLFFSDRNSNVCSGPRWDSSRLDLLDGPRQGKFTLILEKPDNYCEPVFSPDGKRLVVSANADLWAYDLAHDIWTRLTFDGNNRLPIWTPDGQKITYAHFAKAGTPDIYLVRADGAGSPSSN